MRNDRSEDEKMTYLFYKKRLEAIRELLSRETDEGPVMSLAPLDDPHVEQDFWELLNSPVAEPHVMTSAAGLIEIVEGIKGTMAHGVWRDEKGMRLKDTSEWVRFYVEAKQ